jgi:hypothetical protein
VAPREVKSADIYWGALPFVGLQLLLVALVIAFPKQVTMFLDAPASADPAKMRIEIPPEESPLPADSDEELRKLLEKK